MKNIDVKKIENGINKTIFWWKNNLNTWADQEDMKTLTHKINGGEIGLADRINHFHACKAAIQTMD
jgi:predicted chitinase